ncbi:carboxylate--amine ligase [Dysosmobacter sp. HCP28S3_G4]|uniref:carboxylate--amine ligase n=1 Tax=Dysosmobacter sp. HCP28S3_G4 TaxID=3438938 RepID=UPI003F8C2BA8
MEREETTRGQAAGKQPVEFLPIILGGDITTYSLARSFHEEYGVKSVAVSMLKSIMISHSSIIENIVVPDMDSKEHFVQRLIEIAKRYPGKKLLLMACGDWYVRMIVENRAALEEYYVVPYIGEELLNRLVLKDSFYRICDEVGVPYPKTFVYDCKDPQPLDFDFSYPVIAKPASSAAYHYAKFEGKKKVFRMKSEEELSAMLDKLRASGYDYKFLIQDTIPGLDYNMRILTCYCDRHGKVRFFSSGHVLLEDNAAMGVGNPVAIINDVNREIMENARRLLEHVGYTGFANFDIKYDERDGSFRFFEINTRLGRSNFYVTGSGFNAVKWIVDDLIYEKDFDDEPVIADNEDSLYTVVPKDVLMNYVKDDALRQRVKELYAKGCVHDPLSYKGERNLIRRLYPIYFMWKQRKKFRP